MPRVPDSLRSPFLHGVLFLSGTAALGYQIVWIRQFGLGLGLESSSLLAVLTAFFLGLSGGALLLARPIERSAHPARWFAGLELAVAAWGVATLALVPHANELAMSLASTEGGSGHPWLALLVPLATLVPGTCALGALLPAMDRLLSGPRAAGRSTAGLYGANTLGAVAGTLLTTFALLPAFGFRTSLAALAVVHTACGVLAPMVSPAPTKSEDAPHTVGHGLQRMIWLFWAGLLGLGYELLAVRVLSQVLENTIYTFAWAIAVFLIASATGAIVVQRAPARGVSARAPLASATAVACLLGASVLGLAPQLHDAMRDALGPAVAWSAEPVLAAAVLVVPGALMGALLGRLLADAGRHGPGVGRGVGINLLGAALAPVLWMAGVAPHVGLLAATALCGAAYLALVPPHPRAWRLALVPVLLLPVLPRSLMLVRPPEGGAILAWREGLGGTAAVVRNAQGARLLKVNDRFYMGSTAGVFGARRLAHLPLLLHPRPARALFLGVGTGMTFGAAAAHPGLRADGVEISPEVVELMPAFGDVNAGLPATPGLTVHVADARRFVRSTRERYDVIIADLFHPALDGAGAVYTVDHFRAVGDRLRPGGLFCQWLPLHQLDLPLLQVVVASFVEVFPESIGLLAHFNVETPALGLIGPIGPGRIAPGWFASRVTDPRLATALSADGLRDDLSMAGSVVATARELAALAAGTAPQTDDRPVLLFEAPRLVYDHPPLPWALLEALLARPGPRAVEILGEDDDRAAALEAYWRARDLYLRAEIASVTGQPESAVTLLFESARASPDFGTSYARLYREAEELAAHDPARARGVLAALIEARPERVEARALAARLNDATDGTKER